MTHKNETPIQIRVPAGLPGQIDDAAELLSDQLGIRINRSAFIRRAVQIEIDRLKRRSASIERARHD